MIFSPQVVILAGPNGAGKSTSAARFVPGKVPFINADNIVRELSEPAGARKDITAARIFLHQLGQREEERSSFALETNLANRTLAIRIPRWRSRGYHVSIYFIWIPSAEMAVNRVA